MILSRQDLADPEVVKDAEAEFRRCGSDTAYARWALKWGEAMLTRLREAEGARVSQDDLDEAEEEADRAAKAARELESAIKSAVAALDNAMEGVPDNIANRVFEITSRLEEAA